MGKLGKDISRARTGSNVDQKFLQLPQLLQLRQLFQLFQLAQLFQFPQFPHCARIKNGCFILAGISCTTFCTAAIRCGIEEVERMGVVRAERSPHETSKRDASFKTRCRSFFHGAIKPPPFLALTLYGQVLFTSIASWELVFFGKLPP